ncbi:MAG: hypothetical protein AMXMBFR74_09340 [Parvibaculum sp.]
MPGWGISCAKQTSDGTRQQKRGGIEIPPPHIVMPEMSDGFVRSGSAGKRQAAFGHEAAQCAGFATREQGRHHRHRLDRGAKRIGTRKVGKQSAVTRDTKTSGAAKKIRYRRERVITATARKPGQFAAGETTQKIRYGRKRVIAAVTAGQTAAKEISERSKRIAAVAPRKTRKGTFRNQCAKCALLTARKKRRDSTCLTEQHTRQILAQQILAETAFAGGAERRKLLGDRAERHLTERIGDRRQT